MLYTMVSVVFIYLGSDLSKTRPPKATTYFIMEIENLDFPDAVRFLAKRANMDVPEDNTGLEESRRQPHPPSHR